VDESVDTPGSVLPAVSGMAATVIHLGRPLLTCSSALPAGFGRAALDRLLSELAPGGVYQAAPVTWSAGGLLHHRFTLTSRARRPKPTHA